MTISNCKAIFCRLMILYIQYFPMGVFNILDSSVVCTVSSYEFLVFLGVSLFFGSPSHYRWFQVVSTSLTP